MPDQTDRHERHVARADEHVIHGSDLERGVDTAERPLPRDDICVDRSCPWTVWVRVIGDDQDLATTLAEPIDETIENRDPSNLKKALGDPAQTARLTTGKNRARHVMKSFCGRDSPTRRCDLVPCTR